MLDLFFYDIPLGLFAGLLAVALVASSQAGFYWGRRNKHVLDANTKTGLQTLQTSIIGLVGLLLAFSFSMASSRYEQRRNLVVDQANAIGTTFLRTSFLPAPESARIQTLLKEYVAESLTLSYSKNNAKLFDDASQIMDVLEKSLWSESISASKRLTNAAHTTLYFTALNQLIDLHTARKAALQNRVPGAILTALCLMCLLAMFTVGFGWGSGQHQHLTMRVILGLLLVLTMTVIVDMDRSRRGLIKISQQPLHDVAQLFETPR